MAKLALFLALVLVGCGGPAFTVGETDEADGGPPAATGGAPVVGSGGKVGLSTGGSSAGGAGSGGAPSSGGTPSSGGAVGSTGGTNVEADAGTGGATECKPGATRCQSTTALQTCTASGKWGGGTDCSGAYVGGLEFCCVADTCGVRAPSECACASVTHDNGIGQTWQDCVPLGTYNEAQAMKACKASGAAMCAASTRCGPTVLEVQGFDAGGIQIGEWGYGDFATGYVSSDYNLCSPGDSAKRQWR